LSSFEAAAGGSVSSGGEASSSILDHDSSFASSTSFHQPSSSASASAATSAAHPLAVAAASPRFLHLTETVVEVPDQEPLDADAHHSCLNFIMEGRIFLKAALDLLAERDRQAPELGRNDPVIFKSGSLKKASHLMNGVWKPKYVEIRRGVFSYYDNVSSKGVGGGNGGAGSGGGSGGGERGGADSGTSPAVGCELLRKDIPLEAATCTCRAVKFHEKARNLTPTGAIFELAAGNQKRLWMAKTRADRQLWMQTITNAMVGGSVTRGDSFMDHNGVVLEWGARASTTALSNDPRSPYYKNDLRKFRAVQSALKNAKSRQDYLAGLKLLVDQPLKVPVKWVAKQQQQQEKSLGVSSNHTPSGDRGVGGGGAGAGGGDAGDGGVAFKEETVDLSLDQLWRDMQRDSVTINGELFRGDAGHGPERIVGALVRQILGVGLDRPQSSAPVSRHHHRSDVQESQALAYARDILLSGNRTRSGGDAYFCVSQLCQSSDLVVIVPNSAAEPEPIVIDVKEDETDVRVIEKTGWIKTRNKNQKEWRKLFFVLSEGTLSFYESALPRPHRLRGQIVLADSTLSVTKADQDYIMKLSKEGSLKIERSLLFSSEDRLLDWTFALECSIKIKSSLTLSAKKPIRRKINIGGGGETPTKQVAKVDILALAEQSTKDHAAKLGLDEEIVENCLALFSRRATASMVISIRALTEYKVCTLDPTGDEEADSWAKIRAYFLQSFRLGGGASGRIMRGEEIVRISISDSDRQDSPDHHAVVELDPTSPSRRGQNRRIFRRFSTSEEVEEIVKTSSID
jgi:hypothetical protein